MSQIVAADFGSNLSVWKNRSSSLVVSHHLRVHESILAPCWLVTTRTNVYFLPVKSGLDLIRNHSLPCTNCSWVRSEMIVPLPICLQNETGNGSKASHRR